MLKAGYNLVVESSENDADNYRTTVYNGSLENIGKLLNVLDKFMCDGHWESELYGNMELSEEANNFLVENLGKHLAEDFKHDILGIWCEGERYRVVESYSVLHLENDPKNVTEEFIK